MTSDEVRDLRRLVTSRLQLGPAGVDELAAMTVLHSDERVWRHLPSGRHTGTEQTRTYLVERERQWRRDGLGYWIARLREPVGDLRAGEVAGIGGCAVPRDATWWNLYYRFSPDVHGHGLATELAQLAVNAAHGVDQERPVVAFLLEHNHASKRTAERAGLRLMWRGPDVGNPDPNSVRLIYADRPLDRRRLDAITALT